MSFCSLVGYECLLLVTMECILDVETGGLEWGKENQQIKLLEDMMLLIGLTLE